MSPEFTAALKRAIVGHLRCDEVPPGLYPLDHLCEVKVVGAVQRAEDQMVASTVRLPVLEILALVVAKSGIMAPKILDWIVQAVEEAHADPEGRSVASFLETTKGAVRQVQDKLVAKLPKTKRAGAFTGTVHVELLSAVPWSVATKALVDTAETDVSGAPPLAG